MHIYCRKFSKTQWISFSFFIVLFRLQLKLGVKVGIAIAAVILSLLNWRLFVRGLELTDNCLESAHCRFTTPQWHAVDFGHRVQNHATVFHSFAKVKLKTLILNIAQLTGQGGGGGNHKGNDGEELHCVLFVKQLWQGFNEKSDG